MQATMIIKVKVNSTFGRGVRMCLQRYRGSMGTGGSFRSTIDRDPSKSAGAVGQDLRDRGHNNVLRQGSIRLTFHE